MTTRDEQLLIAALSTGALIVGAAAFAWWATEAPPAPTVRLVGSRVHVHGFSLEIHHVFALITWLASWTFGPILAMLVAFKKYRHMWWLEGLILGLIPCALGVFIEWLALADLSNGRERPLSGILSRENWT